MHGLTSYIIEQTATGVIKVFGGELGPWMQTDRGSRYILKEIWKTADLRTSII